GGRCVSPLVEDVHDLIGFGIDDADRIFLDDVAVIAIVGEDREHGSRHGKQPYAAWDASTDAFGELHPRNALTADSESLAQAHVLIAGYLRSLLPQLLMPGRNRLIGSGA